MGVILLGASGTAALLERTAPVRAVENFLADLRQAYLSPPRPQHPKVAVVLVDEATLAGLPCRSPVDRAFLAGLVRQLRERGPLAVGLDVLLDRPTTPAADEALRAALTEPGPPVVVAAPSAPPSDPERAAFLAGMLAAARGADASLLVDPEDGVVRAVRLRDAGGDPGFAAALAEVAGARLPEGRNLRIAWRTGPDPHTPAIRAYPAQALPLLPREWIAGRIVLVGALLDDADRWATPLSRLPGEPRLSGVEIHAHAVAQLLDGESVGEPPPGWRLAMVAAAALLALLLAARLPGPLVLAAVAASGAAAWPVAALLLHAAGAPLLPVVPVVTAFLLSLGLAAAFWRRQEWARRRFVERAFEHYLAPAVVRRIAAEPERLERAAERRELTMLFTDLEGFTTASEALPPERVAEFLAGYFDGLGDIVFAYEGTIDKLVGDALHVLFGAPEPQTDDAARAVRCALDMLRFAEGWRAEWARRGVPFGRTRIGVHRGPVLVGNFGSRRRFDYTAHGDPVNTTSRLEQANKVFGTSVLVSEAVVERCPHLVFRPVVLLRLRGKRETLRVFEPLEAGPDWLPEYVDCYRAMAAGAEEALPALQRLRRRLPDDPVVAFHLSRLADGGRGDLVALDAL